MLHKCSESNFAGSLVQRLRDSSCLIDAATGQTILGRDLPSLIVGFAAGFLRAGLRPGDRLLVSCSVSPSSTLAYLGAMYAGLVPVLAEERLLSFCGDLLLATVQPKAVWSANGVCGDWVKQKGIPELQGSFDSRHPDSFRPAPCTESDLAALMPTSGSTGIPRLVMVSHGNLRSNTEAIIRSQHLRTDERAMLIMPVSYCFGASIVHTHLYQGGAVVFDSRFTFPDKVLRAITAYGCTTFAGVPAVYNILLRRSNIKSIPLPGLRRFLQAGGTLAADSVRDICDIVPNAEFLVMYGQTEATARISCLPASRLREKFGSVGLPLDNLEVRIVDEKGRELSELQTGEIQVRGPSVCSGYLDDPEVTERKFREGWLRTGDYASRDSEGYLWIKGRANEFIKMRGLRVSIGEVEAKVSSIPGVFECAAVAVKHPEAGEALALFIVAADEAGGLLEKVQHELPPHWSCASIKLVPQLPKTNGKIARSELQLAV